MKSSSKKRAMKAKSKPDTLDALYKAACSYIDERDGKVVVIGGVQIISWPDDGEYRFSLCLPITGKRPIPQIDRGRLIPRRIK